LTSHDGRKRIRRAELTSFRDGPTRRSFLTDAILSLPHPNAKTLSLSLHLTHAFPLSRHSRYTNEDVQARTNKIIPIRTSIHTYTHPHTHARPHIHIHTSIHTHTNTYERKKCTRTNPYPRKPLATQLVLPISPRKPFANQLALPTPTRTALTNKPAYSHECYPLLTEVPRLSLLSRTPSLTNVSPSHLGTVELIHALSHTLSLTDASPSHPRLADFNSVLPRTRAPPKRKRAPPNVRNSRENDWQETPVLGPRGSKFAPFLGEFSEPPSGNRLLLAI
jgi:hypothetical protein